MSERGMRVKTIKSVLAKKFDSFLASIKDDEVRTLVRDNTIITGGCIASMLLGEKVNDFDLYFTNRETARLVAWYYVGMFKEKVKHIGGVPYSITVDDYSDERIRIVVKSAGVASEESTEKPYQYFEGRPDDEANGYVSEVMGDTGEIEETYQETETKALETEDDTYRPVFLSTNAITLSNKIQLVLRFYGDADTLHENYDFAHCTNYWTSKDRKLVLRDKALECLLSKELRYIGSKYPVCSIIRLRKFLTRGWVINAGQILKILFQISELDLTNPDVLRDQLTGVDSAYFCQLMDRLHEKDPEKVNAAYLVEIIDRMF